MAFNGFSVQRNGYVHVGAMMADVIDDLKTHGFTIKAPVSWTKPVGAGLDKFQVTLEASDCDPLNGASVENKQPWRMCIDVLNKHTVGVILGTPIQLPDAGGFTYVTGADGSKMDILGSLGSIATDGRIDPEQATEGFINRSKRIGVTPGAENQAPLSYRLSVTPRGVLLICWEDATSEIQGKSFSWFLVQRPVDRTSGEVVTTGKAPVFCLHSNGGEKIFKTIVRESDVLRPTDRYDATQNVPDSEACINSVEQVSITEENKYVITFPSRLNTPRYRYTHELDMLGITSADVVSQWSDVPLTVFGESTARVYKALHANGSNNTKMRLLALVQGGGITA